MKTIIVSLLIAGFLMYPTLSEAQFDNDGGSGEENNLGSGHSPRDLNENTEEKSLDLDHLEYVDPNPTPTPRPTEVPFDGGITALLIAGVAYGAKKAASRAKNRKLLSKEK